MAKKNNEEAQGADRPVTDEPQAYPEGQGDPQVQAAAASYTDAPDADPTADGQVVDREITDTVAGQDL